jgi:hypothetical protein
MFWNCIFNPDNSSRMPPSERLDGRKLGRVLVKMGKSTREQVIRALTYQKRHGGLLGQVMVKLGFIQPVDILAALTAQRGEP